LAGLISEVISDSEKKAGVAYPALMGKEEISSIEFLGYMIASIHLAHEE